VSGADGPSDGALDVASTGPRDADRVLAERVSEARGFVEERLGAGRWSWRRLAYSAEGTLVLHFARGKLAVVAKCYADRPERGARAQAALGQLMACAPPSLRVPSPLAWDAGRGLLLMEALGGRALAAVRPASEQAAMRRVGRALRALHESGIDLGPPLCLADHVRDLVRPTPAALVAFAPDAAETVAAFEERVRAHDVREAPSVPLHRDFQLRQLFDQGDAIGVVDWDDCATGDPAFDLAYLTTYLRTHFGPVDAARGIEGVLEGYAPDDGLTGRLPLYAAFNALRRACRRLRLRDAGWEMELRWMVGLLRDSLR